MKRVLAIVIAAAMLLCLAACGEKKEEAPQPEKQTSFKVGVCNYVDDASLNQIYENISNQLAAKGQELGVEFEILYQNCNADAQVLNQIISNFIAEEVDLMVGIATPVAMAMQAATEDNGIPVVFAAVSDPLAAGLVASLEAPGSNITGTSDYLDTAAVMQLIYALKPEAKKIGLLYDLGQDSSTTAIAAAKAYLEVMGAEIIEANGENTQNVISAAQSLADAKVDAVFTPTDNTIMNAELSIYEIFRDAGIPQFTGADSFALNGAFLGYGVDYANLGVETGDMVVEILVNGADPAATAVRTFDNGTATINTEICEALGYDFAEVSKAFEGLCTRIAEIQTAESF